ncbi:MAG: beta-glucosidase-related glycosidase [uncultured bacterium]|nr:MAG: beta-glucosidase-related glycosidase [uncultured bacterium]
MNFGQCLIIGFPGTKVSKELEKIILKHDLFGVIFFSRNFTDKSQLTELCSNLQTIKSKVSEDKLIISADYEGGFVTRFNGAVNPIPCAYSQGLAQKKAWTEFLYGYNARELKQIGINLNLAPVCDVVDKNCTTPIGIRSFGCDPLLAGEFASSAMKGIMSEGILCCAKHFPGLGTAKYDSHFFLPEVKSNLKSLLNKDLIPFKKLINKNIPFIMSSHCAFPSIEKNKIPATFSYVLNTELLKNKLKFKGVLLSDDLCMNAIAAKWDIQKSSYNALKSGIDTVLVCHEFNRINTLIKSIGENYKNKNLNPEQFSESQKRRNSVLKLVENIDKNNDKISGTSVKQKDSIYEINQTHFKSIKEKISRKSFVIFNKKPELNKAEKILLIKPEGFINSVIEDNNNYSDFFSKFKFLYKNTVIENLNSSKIKDTIKDFKSIVLITSGASKEDLLKLIAIIQANKIKLDLVVCTKNHNDFFILKKYCKNIILTHGFSIESRNLLLHYLS